MTALVCVLAALMVLGFVVWFFGIGRNDTGATTTVADGAEVAETLPITPRAASVAYRGTLAPCELPEVEDIKRITYNPLDTIVLRVRGTLSADAADRLRYQIASQFRGHKVIVLDSGMTLDVLAPDEDDR